jgi:signal transduction histidine kinase
VNHEEKIEPLFASPNEAVHELRSHEWMRLGRELHDNVGQLLSGVTFLARALESKLSARGLPEASDAAEIGHFVFQALTQTRNLARGIFPIEFQADELIKALTDLAGTLEKLFGISCRVEAEADWVVGDQTVANHLFRLTQEAVNNSVKHGRATELVVGLRRHEHGAELFIRDNGIGLPVLRTKSEGLGLRIMNYRAQKIGGRLSVEPAEDGGTLVRCIFSSHLTERH